MNRVSTMLGVDRDDYDFYYLNEVIGEDDTPESMAMEDLGLIEMCSAFRSTALDIT